MQETIYYGDGAVWVTSRRFVVGEHTYWLSDVGDVEVGKVSGSQWVDRGGGFNWAWIVVPLALTFFLLRVWRVHGPVELAIIATLWIVALMWRNGSKDKDKDDLAALESTPVYVIKAKGKQLKHILFASLDEGHTRRLADLVKKAIRAADKGQRPYKVPQTAFLEPPRGYPVALALETYFNDGLVCVTSEVVHVGRESYPLRGVHATYVHIGRIDWYTADAAYGFFVILTTDKGHKAILATTESDYAYKVQDSIRSVLKEVSQDNLRKSY